jgi:flavin-dependent dehydrogenase
MSAGLEVLVIGGGPAGSATAILLVQAGFRVALLERQRFPRPKVCGEYLSLTNWPILRAMGLASAFHAMAGPEVRRVGLLAGTATLSAELPRPPGWEECWGRALSRDKLDSLLLERAAELGVELFQPWSAVNFEREGPGQRLLARSLETQESRELRAPVIVAAHGSYEPGPLPTQLPASRRGGDLLAWKARFREVDLPAETMPLLSFPGGYGGLVQAAGGLWTLSACLRRDVVSRLPRSRGQPAGEAVLAHMRRGCPALERALSSARREGRWLSAGPIRPGIRAGYREGAFLVGNAAGEAHPVVAEGITMALQSAWLLAGRLAAWKGRLGSEEGRRRAGAEYQLLWRRSFAPRIRASSLFARWAMNRAGVSALLPLLRRFPGLLTRGALWSGKAAEVAAAAAAASGGAP